MSFSKSQYETVAKSLQDGLQHISSDLPKITPAVASAVNQWYIPGFAQHEAVEAAGKAVGLLEEFVKTLEHLVEGILAPLYFYDLSWKWRGPEVQGIASTVSADIQPDLLKGQLIWNSSAATSYESAISLQSPAAGKIADIAGSVATSLDVCATAGMVFYAALVTLVIDVVKAVISIGVGGIDTLALVWTFIKTVAAITSTAKVAAALTALLAVLTAQATQMSALIGDASDNKNFPHGNWPPPLAKSW
ncbi:MAG: hypothetical protein J2P25_23370 [Nocardiopsaceae bacterium]|nr:hypothetical protein [Nocardiopsaceae bacterium]